MMVSALLIPSAAFFPSMADAQSGAVVQAVPSEAAVGRLNSSLAKLSRAPQDVEALLGAAQAALDLGDVQAANGFFTRANLVNPNLPAAKLGLAVVELALKQPQEAAANFDAAESLGEHARGHLADRGLAYDLTGQQAKAQRDYQAALRENAGDTKARLRYAVSLGISGKLLEADQLLEAPLKAGDREAWRFRAFIYAMNGKPTDARNITQNVMPKGLADALDPYMVRVPLLTPAQKAAAAHYGDFPANVLRMTPPPQQVVVAAATPQQWAVEPAKKDDSKKSRNSRDRGKDSKPAVQTVIVTPTPVSQPTPSRIDLIPPPPPLSEPVQVARGPRDAFQRDRDRIIHSISFRRLRHKTQVFIAPDGDHFRVRLTHSIEVAQIGRTVARALGLNEDLTEALCLAHDIGHPPFGHAGEDALQAALVGQGGFDHNGNTLAGADGDRQPLSVLGRAQPDLGDAGGAGQA
jgi:tetratricopeptide (TPR) repeat protein